MVDVGLTVKRARHRADGNIQVACEFANAHEPPRDPSA
jgi:hypothetical protein